MIVCKKFSHPAGSIKHIMYFTHFLDCIGTQRNKKIVMTEQAEKRFDIRFFFVLFCYFGAIV